MILLADSGSTKTDWALLFNEEGILSFTSSGLNPSVLAPEMIAELLRKEVDVKLQLFGVKPFITEVHFFGAGCTEAKCPVMADLLAELVSPDAKIHVASDMLGAAIAACEGKAGIAAILGTGANSCLFDGEKIVANTPALGYILGDEGSGAVLGKIFINKVLKGTLPESLCREFLDETGLDKFAVIEKVYRQPAANKFLASFSPFIHSHLDVKELREVVVENFISFFNNNIQQYGNQSVEVNIVGSMGFYYEAELREAAEKCGYTIGRIIKSPIEGLISYYSLMR